MRNDIAPLDYTVDLPACPLVTDGSTAVCRLDMMAARHSLLKACKTEQRISAALDDVGIKTEEVLLEDGPVPHGEKENVPAAAMLNQLRMILATTAFCWNPAGD